MSPDVVAIIPARGGSKGVPHKNRRLLAGKPLIEYSIEAAKQAASVGTIIVTSDDPAILEIAARLGVTALLRPSAIAEDASPVIDAVRHALGSGKAIRPGAKPVVVLLQPTSPLRTGDDIDLAVGLYVNGDGSPVCSVYRCEDNHPARMYSMVYGHLVPLMPELAAVRRQDLPPVYHRNGAMYVFGDAEIESGEIIHDPMIPYVMDASRSLNIDTELDFAMLEFVLERNAERSDR